MYQFFLMNFKKMTYSSTYNNNNNYYYYYINSCNIRQSKIANHFIVVSLPNSQKISKLIISEMAEFNTSSIIYLPRNKNKIDDQKKQCLEPFRPLFKILQIICSFLGTKILYIVESVISTCNPQHPTAFMIDALWITW